MHVTVKIVLKLLIVKIKPQTCNIVEISAFLLNLLIISVLVSDTPLSPSTWDMLAALIQELRVASLPMGAADMS